MGSSGTYSIIMIAMLFALMYFMMIRPEKKRKQQAQLMRDNLKKGDIITTIGGVIGRVVSITQDTFVIETSDDRVRVEFAKWALSTVGVQTTEQPEPARRVDKSAETPEIPEEPEAPEEVESSDESEN